MIGKKYNIKEVLKIGALFLFLMLLGIGTAWAEGSKDLYPAGAQGGRAYLRASTTESAVFPFPTLATHYVYAEAGERIALASSAQGNGNTNLQRWNNRGKIRLYGPNGNPISLNSHSGTNSTNSNIYGNIPNRGGELAGPRLPGQSSGTSRYTPIYHEVAVSGIYRVEFLGTANNTTGDNRMNYVAANANWSQDNNSNYIAAWDISVAKQTGSTWNWVNGRVYTSVLNMDNPSFYDASSWWESAYYLFRENSGFYGEFKVLTRDGYVYNVDNNGNQGLSFAFMVNSRGFHMPGDRNTPSYKSIPANSASAVQNRYHDPTGPDDGSAVTHKIFYNLPDGNMPENAIGGPESGQQTWLRTEEVDLTVSEILIEGVEGSSPNQLGNKGAYIKFNNQSGGDYYITIRPKPNSTTSFAERELTGNSVIGENKIFWDGKDGNGVPLNVGTADVQVEIKLRGAEVHFPYIDMELNHNGIILELLTKDLTSVVTDKVFWDDSGIRTVNTSTFGSMSSPINASHTNPSTSEGISSNTNGHKWGVGSNRTVGTFGDDQGMDTWTFIEGVSTTTSFEVEVKEANLYTEIEYSVDGVANAQSGKPGYPVSFSVKAGNDGPSDVEGATFTFTVPVGIDITDPNNISFTTSCANQSGEGLIYNESTRTFSSELDLPDGCTITYTFTGTLSGSLGIKTVESTILRPNDVTDPDATNDDINVPPTNPHYECFNDPSSGGAITCNNIQEATFMLLDDCAVEYLYYEDFGRTTFEVNSGRKTFDKRGTGQPSIKLDPSSGMPEYVNGVLQRNFSALGGATETYLFAPGIDDSDYNTANGPHGPNASVARIKNGYYAVTPPGYVQMGIPEADSWRVGAWDPNAPTNDPDDPNSNYDWTQAWDKPNAIRDISGAVNGAAFLVRGAAAASQSIKPFYEFDVNGTIVEGQTYTLSMYSYVTYHDKDYMIMDVVDRNNGHIYASVPLKYPGPGLPPGATPEGFSLGWVPLQASFTFSAEDACDDISGKEVKIAIRGSQDRALDTGKGFGHTLIDDISFIKRTTGGVCSVPASSITCEDPCYEEVEGEFDKWLEKTGHSSNDRVIKTLHQPATNGGFILDIYYLDNSFNMNINGIDLYDEELEFQQQGGYTQNVRFKSDGGRWEQGGIPAIWSFYEGVNITEQNLHDYRPVIRVDIDKYGNVTLLGARVEGGILEELEVFNSQGVQSFNSVHWFEDSSLQDVNTIEVSQKHEWDTGMTLYGYGQNVKECEFCDLEKEGVFDDNNNDGFAHAGETITYTFDVINAGDMEIHDITITDPLFGFTIELDENTHQPTLPGITFTGDTNNDGILDRHETWTFTVKYEVTNEDIFNNEGVYNRATVTGVGKIGTSKFQISEESTDPTPYTDQDDGWDPTRPFHTYVPLEGSGLMITNPNIYHRLNTD